MKKSHASMAFMETFNSRYCAWCGAAMEEGSRALDEESIRCPHCQRGALSHLDKSGAQQCESCRALFAANSHYCPSCGTASKTSPPSTLQTEHGLLPSPWQPIWPIKTWWKEDGEGLAAPPCPACGEKLRPDGAGSHQHIGQANPPWNAGWDGSCAACGQAVKTVVNQRTHFEAKRTVTMRPAESFHQTFRDEGMVFAGVQIRVEEFTSNDSSPRVSELFLSMGEFVALARSLETSAKPLLSQMDWTCDWT